MWIATQGMIGSAVLLATLVLLSSRVASQGMVLKSKSESCTCAQLSAFPHAIQTFTCLVTRPQLLLGNVMGNRCGSVTLWALLPHLHFWAGETYTIETNCPEIGWQLRFMHYTG